MNNEGEFREMLDWAKEYGQCLGEMTILLGLLGSSLASTNPGLTAWLRERKAKVDQRTKELDAKAKVIGAKLK